jgi:UDP-glucose:(heptosyl)LPS alpha-1,3-glucosyltransferase
LEALASGLPVITTTSNGAGGILMNGQGGSILFDPREGLLLRQRISFFLNQEVRKSASIEARSIIEDYSIERNWREMKEIITRVCQK